MKRDLFFVLDQGTTHHKLVIFDRCGVELAVFESPAPLLAVTRDGLGSDALALSAVSDALIERALAAFPGRFFAFGFANQGETVVAWDNITGAPLSSAVSWQCGASRPFIEEQHQKFSRIRELSGLVPSAYFSAPKIQRLLAVNSLVADAAMKNRLAVGTLDAWMIWRWTQGRHFVTDPTTACRTLLFDTFSGIWSDDLLGLFRLRADFLPRVLLNHQFEIGCDAGPFSSQSLPLIASLCDQPAALIGHGGLSGPLLKATFGTGAFIDLSLPGGAAPVDHLLTSVLHHGVAGASFYRDGGVFSFVSAIDWMRANWNITLEQALERLRDAGGLHALPAFSGLGAPHFRSDVETVFSGVSGTDSSKNLAGAVLRGLIFRVCEVLEAMASVDVLPDTLCVDGGLSRVTPLMQLLSDVSGLRLAASDEPHVTARGVAHVICERVGENCVQSESRHRVCEPNKTPMNEAYAAWRSFVKRTLAESDLNQS